MEKLELKHLAPYLPYGLEAIYNEDNEEDTIVSVTGYCLLYEKPHFQLEFKDGSDNVGMFDEDFKPILRPLSDLTKDENFIAFCNEEIICGSWRFKNDDLIINIETTEKNIFLLVNSGEIADECPLLFYKWMVKNHYDISGLIEKGLAVDKNTLTASKQY